MKNDFLYLIGLKSPEITTSMLLGALSDYKDPRKKINSLSRKGLIIPIKQGVYLINNELGLRTYSKEILANLIYGPSYISLETALSNYGFIPERVSTTTSICIGRGKSFATAVGQFDYHHIKESLYPVGVQLKEVFKDTFCQHASPEKSLLDLIYIKEKQGEFSNQKEYFNYIIESYRLDLKTIENSVSLKKIQSFAELYPFKHVRWFANELVRKLIK
jgi:hypothetical protein